MFHNHLAARWVESGREKVLVLRASRAQMRWVDPSDPDVPWADTTYRTKANEQHLADNGLRSQVHRRKPQGRPMPAQIARGNGRRSKVRAAVEHVFAKRKGPMVLVVRTIGLARAIVKIGLANIVYNMHRAVQLDRTRVQTA